jgi:hypothetical protein
MRIIAILLILIINSCSFNREQNDLLQKLKRYKPEIYKDSFQLELLSTFSKNEIIKLASNKNPNIAIAFFKCLIKKYPSECFQVCLKNIDNKKIMYVQTSYDTQIGMTVGTAMLYFAYDKQNVITEKELNTIIDMAILDFENRWYLGMYVGRFLAKNVNKPDPRYYSSLKQLIISYPEFSYFDNLSLLKYFNNYNISEDSIVINKFIKKLLYHDYIYINEALTYIIQSPQLEYFPILEDYYYSKIIGKNFRADEIYFELKLFMEATLQYKSPKAIKIIDGLVNDVNYHSDGFELVSKEHIYQLLKNTDSTSYFIDVTKTLKKKINHQKLAKIDF